MMVRFERRFIYFKDGDQLFYKDKIIQIEKTDPGEWDIINTSNGLIRHLSTINNDEIYLDLIEAFVDEIGINLEEGEHLQFVDDTNESVRVRTQ